MNISKYAILLGIIPSLFLSSCATILQGTKQTIGISSTPSSADIWIDGQYIGKSPMAVKLLRQDNHLIRLELDGYLPHEIYLTKKLNQWTFGNIIFGGFIGLAVDAISGAIYKLTPDQVHAHMSMNHASSSKKGDNSYIAVVLEPDASWEKIGQLESTK